MCSSVAVLEEFEEDAKEIADSLEIIGNVYENKEFLEEKINDLCLYERVNRAL
ncbi:hypothetical protein STRDD10_01577 [Streptococcus sp. DD10]|nr:hypothetical protein STRDD10_01577 [Streptococcus sp. DD10]